jgi:hypothetical protein
MRLPHPDLLHVAVQSTAQHATTVGSRATRNARCRATAIAAQRVSTGRTQQLTQQPTQLGSCMTPVFDPSNAHLVQLGQATPMMTATDHPARATLRGPHGRRKLLRHSMLRYCASLYQRVTRKHRNALRAGFHTVRTNSTPAAIRRPSKQLRGRCCARCITSPRKEIRHGIENPGAADHPRLRPTSA